MKITLDLHLKSHSRSKLQTTKVFSAKDLTPCLWVVNLDNKPHANNKCTDAEPDNLTWMVNFTPCGHNTRMHCHDVTSGVLALPHQQPMRRAHPCQGDD